MDVITSVAIAYCLTFGLLGGLIVRTLRAAERARRAIAALDHAQQ